MDLPEVRSCTWSTERHLPLRDWLREAGSRTGLDAAALERLVWHGGLHAGGTRLGGGGALPETVPAGRASAYWFAIEPRAASLAAEAILLDRDDVVVVDKPAGMHTQPTRASTRLCLEHALRDLLGDPELRAVHRLDRPTSGAILFARGRAATGALWRQLAAREIRRAYAAVVSPPPMADAWSVRGTLVQRPHPSHAYFELVANAAAAGGRFSHTELEVVARDGRRALVRALPRTGRTHQIRVHLAAGGTPIEGDGLYGTGAAGARLLLHAAEVGFRVASRAVRVTAPLGDHWPKWARDGWGR